MNKASAWQNSPIEVKNLFNPAFCGLLLNEIVQGYQSEGSKPFPIVLSFLGLPICLNRNIRAALPKSSSTSIAVWISNHQHLMPIIYDRTKGFGPYVFSTISYMTKRGLFELQDESISTKIIRKPRGFGAFVRSDIEITELFRRSIVVGKWFAKAGKPKMIYSLFGVSP